MSTLNNLLFYLLFTSMLVMISCGGNEDDQDVLVDEEVVDDQEDITDDNSDDDTNTAITDHVFVTHENKRVSSMQMTASEYQAWIDEDHFRDNDVSLTVFNDIYKQLTDEYDFIFLVLNEEGIPENLTYYGMLKSVSNDILGTGQDVYDYSADYGSGGKLKAVMQLTGLRYLKSGPALHELMHNWGNFGIPTESVEAPGSEITSTPFWPHWGFTGGSSPGQLGGFDQSSLEDLGNDLYSVASFGPFANGGNGIPYNELELYLMGMISIDEVHDFDAFGNITSLEILESTFQFTANKRTTYNGASIKELLGERVPSHVDAKKDFKLLVVVLTDTPLTDDEWNEVNDTAAWFEFKGADDISTYNFWEATNGAGSISIGQ